MTNVNVRLEEEEDMEGSLHSRAWVIRRSSRRNAGLVAAGLPRRQSTLSRNKMLSHTEGKPLF